jgi:hypothetical protein
MVKHYNDCRGLSITDTDDANMDSAKSIAKMSEQEYIFYPLRGIPTNNKWIILLEHMMDTMP